ncbi:hypothetical protein ANO11243_050280 [Dothideomycetidae sp. 11243]|nr:hypothetical protein ANO11243_050280 [fungal sp. No.11243]
MTEPITEWQMVDTHQDEPALDTVSGADSDSQHGKQTIKLMIAGDSMTTGSEGDHTWRYRLWDWLRMTPGVQVEMVGPFTGTQAPQPAIGPQPPRFIDEPEDDNGPDLTGAYARDTHPDWPQQSRHFSQWGYRAAQCKDDICDQVATYQPDYLLVALGFNDMGWCVSDATGTLESMRGLVDNARRGKKDVKIVLATVPHRTFLRDELILWTDDYNMRIRELVDSLTSADSQIKLAEFQHHYGCNRYLCPAGYDGLHPNALGEYQIAKAFSVALQEFGLRQTTSSLVVPIRVPEPSSGEIKNLKAVGSAMGVRVTWDPVFGARAYEVRNRVMDSGQPWNSDMVGAARFDTTFTGPGTRWEYMVRVTRGDAKELKSPWSRVVDATAKCNSAPGPKDIKVTATEKGCRVKWSAVEDWKVERYEITVWDKDTPGAFIQCYGVRGTEVELKDLQIGHKYECWVGTWSEVDGELAGSDKAGARPFIPGGGRPNAPTGLQGVVDGDGAVKLSWKSQGKAAGYLVYKRRVSKEPLEFETDDEVVHETDREVEIHPFIPSQFEFHVKAINGELESKPSNTIMPSDE